MGVDRCGGEGQCGDQVGAPGAREKDIERGTAARRSLSSGHDLLSIDPKFSLKEISNWKKKLYLYQNKGYSEGQL